MQVMVDDHPVHVATGGVAPTGDEPIIVLIHGAANDGTVWQLQTRWLAHHGVRPLAVDLPGHGRSSGQPLPSIEDMADWLIRFLDAAAADGLAGATEPVHLAGHSMGSFIALEASRRHPDRVASLVLLGTAEAMPVHPELQSSAADDLPRAAALMASWGHGSLAKVGPNPTPGLWMVGGARALVETSQPGTLTVDFEACTNYQGASAAAAVGCPVTLVAGRVDKMTPARSATGLAAEMPDDLVSVEVLDAVGHFLMTEASSEVRRILLEAVQVSD